MSVESLSPAVVFAVILGLLSLAFGIYQAQKGAVPGQREELRDMHAELALQKGIVESLQRQGYDNWRRIQETEVLLARLKSENEQLKALTTEQAILITALQRQLTGLARGNVRTGRKLRDILTKRLSAEEVKQWAFDLNVPVESLSGDTLPALVVSMLDYLERYGKLEEGLSELRRLRPDIPLEDAT
jgi:hypothetical protein